MLPSAGNLHNVCTLAPRLFNFHFRRRSTLVKALKCSWTSSDHEVVKNDLIAFSEENDNFIANLIKREVLTKTRQIWAETKTRQIWAENNISAVSYCRVKSPSNWGLEKETKISVAIEFFGEFWSLKLTKRVQTHFLQWPCIKNANYNQFITRKHKLLTCWKKTGSLAIDLSWLISVIRQICVLKSATVFKFLSINQTINVKSIASIFF